MASSEISLMSFKDIHVSITGTYKNWGDSNDFRMGYSSDRFKKQSARTIQNKYHK